MFITIPFNVLKAVSLAMAKKDVRYYMNGVCLSVKNGKAYLVATDGARLHAASLGETEGVETFEAIIPADAVISALKIKRPKGGAPASFQFDAENGEFVLSAAGQTIGGVLIDGHFPDWRRVIASADGQAMNHAIQVKFIVDALEALNLIEHAKYTAIQLSGENAGVFHRNNFCAVVMPLREHAYPTSDEGFWSAIDEV